MSNYKLDPPGLDPLYTFKPSEPVFAFTNTKPSHNIIFHNQDGKQVGALNFNGPEMTFTGDADESAKVFFDFIARSFKARLEQERADERWEQSKRRGVLMFDPYCGAPRHPSDIQSDPHAILLLDPEQPMRGLRSNT
jgi:hypothetical protein